ncbi:hypothetical protein TPHA_0A00950 [Tetrapisispora phaffii CBS 4417]|uniref:Altered inheritance of mitochondria protein 11 n=1 Tax=Tetrapisispora phaffii (strain ATCC 24235 / CBS 4417 / NBRC 1672 / NRRL Y-8282 / UCD 70-5) TaxID=1071381 RepID=G8BMQ2_TETPH|nr:hypothetical protein TPHA_0A00950 [Tetrapisispora phaffii CBS 4417]CCE61180.1 hypothetical protein TPHA_0A00950 [Tetrapisispora phaffii CBS 4417]
MALSNCSIDEFGARYRERRRYQMMKFFGFSIMTLLLCRVSINKVKASVVKPSYFELNYSTVAGPGDLRKNLLSSMLLASGITVGVFGMLVNGSCWTWDISNLTEFRKYKGIASSLEDNGTSPIKRFTNLPLVNEEMQEVYDAVDRALQKL